MIDKNFVEIGQAAYFTSESSAPFCNSDVRAALAKYPSWSASDKKARTKIMKDFSKGWKISADQTAEAAIS